MTEAGIQAFAEFLPPRPVVLQPWKKTPAAARGMSEFTWRHLVRTYGEKFAEICVLPDAEYWRVVSARMQTQNTERDLINEIMPFEGGADARRLAPPRDPDWKRQRTWMNPNLPR